MNDLFGLNRIPSQNIDASPDIQLDWSDEPNIGGLRIVLEGGELLYSERFFSSKLADRMISYFQENDSLDWAKTDWTSVSAEEFGSIKFHNINWKQDHIRFFGKTHPLPRLTSWYGDPGASYSYSGIRSDPNPWNEGLLFVKSKIESALGVGFNSVLLNWYRGGADSLNWHSDNEKELGPEPIIASANFGATREFLIRKKQGKDSTIKFKLAHGSLLVMMGKTQQNWVHSIPKRKGIAGSRFNLTFRQIDPV